MISKKRATHTAGEWHFDEPGLKVFDNKGRKICSGSTDIPSKEDASNLILISAAPDMLRVLKEIMSWEENAQTTWATKALKAIAKAERNP